MTDRITLGANEIASVGTTIPSLEPAPSGGTWEITAHPACSGDGQLRALTPGEPAPLCRVCGCEVDWRLTDLAPAPASDPRGGRTLP